jgi:hypothetical protein
MVTRVFYRKQSAFSTQHSAGKPLGQTIKNPFTAKAATGAKEKQRIRDAS